MTFASILFQGTTLPPAEERFGFPEFFRDLCLDQVTAAIAAAKEDYHLIPFMLEPLRDADAVAYAAERGSPA